MLIVYVTESNFHTKFYAFIDATEKRRALKCFATDRIGAVILKIRWIRFTIAYFIFGTQRNAGGL